MVALKDILSHLTYAQACKMLGPKGEQLIRHGGRFEISIDEQVSLTNNHFHLHLPDAMAAISIDLSSNNKLTLSCSSCTVPCQHQGAALSLILEEKLALGLAAPPPEKVPIEELSDAELIERAIIERQERSDYRKDAPGVCQPRRAVDRLHHHQCLIRQKLPRGIAGMGTGRILLFMPGFQKEYAGYL